MKKGHKLGSIVTGIGLGLLFGYWINLVLNTSYFNYQIYVLSISGALFAGFLGYIKPKWTEALAYVISAYILLQFLWDVAVEPNVGELRYSLFYRALILLIINSFSGYYGFAKGRDTFLKALGLK